MIRSVLPVALSGLFASLAIAENLHVPGLSPDNSDSGLNLPPCILNSGSQDSCARTLACIGSNGLWFDGQARGWNSGTLVGIRSDGVPCAGTWAYGSLIGSASAKFECKDGLSARAIYYAQDDETGTGIARGIDSKGRFIRAWTGKNVLQFFGQSDVERAKLPCTEDVIPIS
ncbi:MAG: hypothetical protein AAF754_00615 [Pseudomonadota bacterium]